jgi:hypothetical protein
VEVLVSLASWVGVAVGVGALIFAWLAWRVSKQELRLAQEEAELRPKLVISFKKVVYRHRLAILGHSTHMRTSSST